MESQWINLKHETPECGRLLMCAGVEHDIFLARRKKNGEFHTLSGSYRIVEKWRYADDMQDLVDDLICNSIRQRKPCMICGKLFMPIRETHKTCGPKCSYERQLRASNAYARSHKKIKEAV